MKTAFLSDLHIGVPLHPADDFGTARDLTGVLSALSDQVDLIILDGDIFELWQFGWRKISLTRRREIAAINRYADVLVRGNHDSGLPEEPFPDVNVVNSWDYEGLRAVHGHEQDRWNSGPLGWIGRAVAWWGGIGEAAVSRDIDVWFSLAQRLLGNGRYTRNATYRERVRQSAGEDAEAVVMGHTHSVDIGLYPPGIPVWNAGTWTRGRQDVLIVEGAGGDWSCRPWSGLVRGTGEGKKRMWQNCHKLSGLVTFVYRSTT